MQLIAELIDISLNELYEKGVLDIHPEDMETFQSDCQIEYDFSPSGVSIVTMHGWLIFIWWMNGQLEAYHTQSVSTVACQGCGLLYPVSELQGFHGRKLCNNCRWVGIPKSA